MRIPNIIMEYLRRFSKIKENIKNLRKFIKVNEGVGNINIPLFSRRFIMFKEAVKGLKEIKNIPYFLKGFTKI